MWCIFFFVVADFYFGSERSMITTDQSKIEGDQQQAESLEDETRRIIGTNALRADMSRSEPTFTCEPSASFFLGGGFMRETSAMVIA